VIALIDSLSIDSDEILEQLQKELKKSQEILTKNIHNIDAVISGLDYKRHSLGILHLLSIKSGCGNIDTESFIHQVIQFIKHCSVRQIRVDPKKFRQVCYKFTEICRETRQPIRAIQPLKHAINKIGSGEHITPQHAMFVQSCVTAKCYKAALPILERFVFKIDPDLTGVESVDTRLYFYYGGICFIGMKKFNKALEFFEAVISAPALVVSSIMVEAYKKYVLVSLCRKGEISNLPRYTNSALVRLFKQLYPGYEEFTNSFSTRSVEDLHKVAENHAELFIKDGNMGLVKQAIQALYRQNIQRLTKTYITLSLQNITEQVGLPNAEETERRVFRMIQNGQVFASVNQKDGMVEFFENPEQFNNNKTLDYLDKQIHDSIQLTRVVNKIDEEIALDSKYIQKILQAERGPSRWPGGEGTEDEMMAMDKPGFHQGPAGFKS